MKKICIIDDQPLITEAFSDLLEGLGEIYTYNSGKESYEALNSIKFDLILSDLILPGYNGLLLSKLVENTDTKIIIITANDFFEVPNGSNIIKVVRKPIQNFIELKKEFKFLLERK